jgi:predicted transcriptional regulator
MRLRDVLSITQAQLYSPDPSGTSDENILNREVRNGFGADLMSDALFFDMANGLLITGLVNPQAIRTAEMADVSAVLVVRGKCPLAETAQLAGQIGIPILCTKMTMFEASGQLYAAGLEPARRNDGI